MAIGTMQEPYVSLQVQVPKRLRARLKSQAILNDWEMGDVVTVLLDHALSILENEDEHLHQAVDQEKKDRIKRSGKDKNRG